MLKKLVLVLVLVFIVTGSVFSQRLYKHSKGSVLIGADFWAGYSSEGYYNSALGWGLHLDYYFNSVFSLTTGFRAQYNKYIDGNVFDIFFGDSIRDETYMSIPLMLHLNAPVLDFIYGGVGVSFWPWEVKGAPIFDLGLDLCGAGRGGVRIFMRMEFYDDSTFTSLLIQLPNLKLK